MTERPIRRFGHRAFAVVYTSIIIAILTATLAATGAGLWAILLAALAIGLLGVSAARHHTTLEADAFVIHIRHGGSSRSFGPEQIAWLELPEPATIARHVELVTIDGERLVCPYWGNWYWDTGGMTNLERRCRLAGVETTRTRPWETR